MPRRYDRDLGQDQHFLPQVYLRQWCEDGRLLRYRRVGPEERLEVARKVPKGIAFEPDLYSLPAGGVANGMTGNQLEAKLASSVDARLAELVQKVSAIRGALTDQALSGDLVWLMQTFAARSPTSIRRVEEGVTDLIEAQAPTIEKLIARANTESGRAELRKIQDARMPAVAARAGVAAVAARDLPSTLRWLDGDLHVVQLDRVAQQIRAIGANEFVTFEDPVVAWDAGPRGLTASFTISPAALVLVVERGRSIGGPEDPGAARLPSLVARWCRESLICRTEVTGHVLAAAGKLRPSSGPM